MAYQTNTNHYESTLYIVDDSGNSPYTTIQSAINAANAAGIDATVFIRAGAYTENLTFYDGITLKGYTNLETVLTGVHTPPNSGTIKISDMGMASATDIMTSAAAGTTNIYFENCRFNCTDGFICDMANWTGDIDIYLCDDISTANGVVNNAATASVSVENCEVGVGNGNTFTINGALVLDNTTVGCPIALSGTAVSMAGSGCLFEDTFTISADVDLSVTNSHFSTGANTAFTTTSSVTAVFTNVGVDSSNVAAISGTGTVKFVSVSYDDVGDNAATVGEDVTGIFRAGIVYAPTFDTNVAAAGVTLSATSLVADGTDADISINITAKGAGKVIIDDLQLTADLVVTEGGTGAGTFTDGGLLVGATTGPIEALAVGGVGTILTGVAGSNPTWTTATYPATATKGDLICASTANAFTALTAATNNYVLTANGAGEIPTWQAAGAGVTYCSDAEAIAGTEAAKAISPLTLKAKLGAQTSHGIAYGAGTSTAVAWTAEMSDGQLLVGDTAGVPVPATLTGEHGIAVTNAAGSISIGNLLTLNAQAGTSYTTVIGDQNKYITMTNASASTLTIPKNDTVDYDIGSVIYVQQLGAGQVTLTPAADVVFRSADDAYKLREQYSGVAIVKIAANTFSIFGDVEA